MGGKPVDEDTARVNLECIEMAATHLRRNTITTPIVAASVAWAYSFWIDPLGPVIWTVVTLLTTIVVRHCYHAFLTSPNRARHLERWRVFLVCVAFLGTVEFALGSVLFYVPGERLNNVLAIALLVGSIATVSAMTASSVALRVACVAPYVAGLVITLLVNEEAAIAFPLSFIAIVYAAVTMTFSSHVRRIVRSSILLTIQNERLIGNLKCEKEKAEAALFRAERASRAKSSFLANMSHELRTPLNAILGFSEIIRDQLFGPSALDRYSGYAADINRSGQHLLGLVNDVLDLGRIEAGRVDLAEEDLHLASFIEETLRFVSPQANSKAILVSASVDEGIVLTGDPRAVRQVLVNLLANSVKFTPESGQVGVRVGVGEERRLMVTVWDTGCGIHPDDQQRVLESFGQGRHEIARDNENGVGLGLPIAKGLMEAHGGRLHLKSELQIGTEVTAEFPPYRWRSHSSSPAQPLQKSA